MEVRLRGTPEEISAMIQEMKAKGFDIISESGEYEDKDKKTKKPTGTIRVYLRVDL